MNPENARTVDVNLDEYKQAPTLHVSKLRQQRESLRAKLGTLKVLDKEILSNVEEKEIEMIQLNELIQLKITRIEDFLEASRPITKNVDAPKQKTPVHPRYLLILVMLNPQLTLLNHQ